MSISLRLKRRQILRWMVWNGLGMVIPSSLAQAGWARATKQPDLSSDSNIKALQTLNFKTIQLDHQGAVIAEPNAAAQTYQEDLGHGVSLTMVRIPAGSFIMGSLYSEQAAKLDEKPQHQVNLSAFYMGQTVITQAQYQAIMGENPANFTGDRRPIEMVSWQQAQVFCEKLSVKTGKSYSLPSESQWEYACRAGTYTPFAFGATITTDVVNYNGKFTYANAPRGVYRMATTDVGQFPPNAFGLYDMHGNVWEWCIDSWHDNYQGAPTDGSAWVRGGDHQIRILRGGSWYRDSWVCRSADRFKGAADGSFNYVGFRVVHTT